MRLVFVSRVVYGVGSRPATVFTPLIRRSLGVLVSVSLTRSQVEETVRESPSLLVSNFLMYVKLRVSDCPVGRKHFSGPEISVCVDPNFSYGATYTKRLVLSVPGMEETLL